jgi:hypothetical protein
VVDVPPCVRMQATIGQRHAGSLVVCWWLSACVWLSPPCTCCARRFVAVQHAQRRKACGCGLSRCCAFTWPTHLRAGSCAVCCSRRSRRRPIKARQTPAWFVHACTRPPAAVHVRHPVIMFWWRSRSFIAPMVMLLQCLSTQPSGHISSHGMRVLLLTGPAAVRRLSHTSWCRHRPY